MIAIFIDTPEKKDSRTKLMDFISKHGVGLFIKTFVPSLFYEKNIPHNQGTVRIYQ